jgi:hypothetical protein
MVEKDGKRKFWLKEDGIPEPETIRAKNSSDWKLGFFSLWWLRMARESAKEKKSMKKMTAFFKLNKIQNVKPDSEVHRMT